MIDVKKSKEIYIPFNSSYPCILFFPKGFGKQASGESLRSHAKLIVSSFQRMGKLKTCYIFCEHQERGAELAYSSSTGLLPSQPGASAHQTPQNCHHSPLGMRNWCVPGTYESFFAGKDFKAEAWLGKSILK